MEDIGIATFKDFVGELTAIYRRTQLPTIKIDLKKYIVGVNGS
ncbi:hypothetical protein [Arenibacter sp. 6A1]|nr:hypothetical protein [Arenibacter sp. 6A1]